MRNAGLDGRELVSCGLLSRKPVDIEQKLRERMMYNLDCLVFHDFKKGSTSLTNNILAVFETTHR